MENIKIGIDGHNLEGERTGVGRYLYNLLREWKSVSAEFFLYFKNKIPEDVRGFTPHIQALNAKSNAVFKHWFLPRAAAKDKIDVLFCPDYVLPFRLNRRIKTALTIHDIIYEARPDEYSWPSWKDKILLKWASKHSAKKADVIFVPSEFTKSEILKYYKINPEKIIVTTLAPDPIFHRIGREKKRYILFVGSIFNRRFIPQSIQAFAEFARDSGDFKFLIIGKNHTKPFQDIAALVLKANQALGHKAVIWREYAGDEGLVRLYSGAFATLWLSSYEGFGLPILESMACGTPVITSRAGSLPEVAGDAALYIENPQNHEEIANALSQLARDEIHYNELVQKGTIQAAKFSWQECARETINNTLKLV